MSYNNSNWQKAAQQESIGPHKDYDRNLWNAQTFMKNVIPQMLPGINVCLAEENRVLMISFRPPPDAPMGNFAAPVNLHQNEYVASKETEYYFNAYMKMAKQLHKIDPRVEVQSTFVT